jgi:hypothetical protein
MSRTLAALVLTMWVATPALANDSTATLSTGGLVLLKTDDIEMRSEDLFISQEKVRVVYRFFNKSAKDVTTTVAFPMPDLDFSDRNSDVSIPNPDSQNFLDFQTIVGGRPVTAEIEERAFATDGTERTELLRKLGVPVRGAGSDEALNRLPPAQRDEIIRLGLGEIEEEDVGKRPTKQLSSRWILKSKYFWQQTFPARSELVVEHSYQPSVGGVVQTLLADPKWVKDNAALVKTHCIDKDLLATLDKARRARGDDTTPFSEAYIHYILTSGANWAGPIQDFHLIVDKGDPGNLLSFCGDGVKKIGPTQFEMRKANFMPKDDLLILILKKFR